MNRFSTAIKLITTALLGLTLSACSDDDDDHPTASLRVLHASQDAPAVNLSLDGKQVFANLDYGQSLASTRIRTGQRDLAVEGIISSGNQTVIDAQDLQFDTNTDYDVVALNSVANIEPVVLSKPRSFDGDLRVQVLHAASTAPAVDVHVTAPQAELSANTVLGSFAFKQDLGPVTLDAGDYRIRVTANGQLVPLYDSGTVPLNRGSDLLIAAIANTQVGDSTTKSPIALAVMSDSETATIYHQDDGHEVRVVHNASDAPAVDVFVQQLNANGFSNLAFGTSSNYANLATASYDLDIRVADTTTEVLSDINLALANGVLSSVIAIGDALDENAGNAIRPQGEGLELLVLSDQPRAIATDARLRVVHGAFEAPTVDVYLTPSGDTSSASPALPNFAYKANSGYINVTSGNYYVTLYAAGADPAVDDFALQAGPVNLANGVVYTVVARAATAAEAPESFGLTIISD